VSHRSVRPVPFKVWRELRRHTRRYSVGTTSEGLLPTLWAGVARLCREGRKGQTESSSLEGWAVRGRNSKIVFWCKEMPGKNWGASYKSNYVRRAVIKGGKYTSWPKRGASNTL